MEPKFEIPDSGNYLGIVRVAPIPLDLPETGVLNGLGLCEGGLALLRDVPDWTIPGNVDQTVVWIPLHGMVTLNFEGKMLTVKPGQAVFRPICCSHRVHFDTPEFEHVFLRFSKRIAARIYTTECNFSLLCGELIRRMQFDRLRNRRDSIFAAASMLAGLIAELTGGRQIRIPYEKIQMVIENQPSANWTTKMLAERFHLSDSLFYKLCVTELGKNPTQIIAAVKMNQAEALLRCSDLTLETIAAHLGYSSVYAFSKAFYRFTARRPGAFRKMERTV